MKVVWTEPADKDREQIVSFIALDNPQAAIEMDSLFTEAGASLGNFAFRGRSGRVANTRELLVHKNYIIVYCIDKIAEIVYINAVLHAARQYPPE